MRSVEDSLQRLGLARVDIVYIHDIDRYTQKEEQPRRFREAMDGAYRALERLRAGGVVKAIGLGVNNWEVCRDALAHGDFDGFLLAGRYTLLEQEALASFLPLCVEKQVSIVAGGVFNSGILATGPKPGAVYNYGPAPQPILDRAAALERVCQAHGVPLAAAALQFPFACPAVATVVVGARASGEVEANTALLAHQIPSALWADLKAERLIAAEAPTP